MNDCAYYLRGCQSASAIAKALGWTFAAPAAANAGTWIRYTKSSMHEAGKIPEPTKKGDVSRSQLARDSLEMTS